MLLGACISICAGESGGGCHFDLAHLFARAQVGGGCGLVLVLPCAHARNKGECDLVLVFYIFSHALRG